MPVSAYQNSAFDRFRPPVLQQAAQAQVRHLDPVRALGQPAFVVQHHGDQDAEAQRGDAQVIALQPQDRPAHQVSQNGRDRRAQDHRQRGMQAPMHRRKRAGIAADAGETGMAQADLAGISGQDDDPRRRQGIDEHQRADAVVEARGKEQRRQRDQRRQHQKRCMFLRHHTRSVDLRPNRPCGMKNSTARMTTKAAASLYCDDR